MSEKENQPPTPSKQTSSVPLKKETVRVTLKAADAPQVPTSSVPLAPPVRPPVPGGASKPPTAPPAPTVPLKAPAAPTAPAAATKPAPTIKLATSTAPLTPASPTTTAKLPGTSPTLPKATVQLQPPTAPLGGVTPSTAATLQIEEDDDDEEPHEGLIKILSGVGFAAALVLFALQISLAGSWINVEDNPRQGDWSLLLE